MKKDFHPSFKYGIEAYIYVYADLDFAIQKDISFSNK